MNPGKVKHLDPDSSLAENAEKIVSARLDELWSFAPGVLDPANVEELHEMRIAAKRLRYVLEVTAETCFGPYAVAAE
ncbi:MAG: CHAD domain-containing protein, partial [Solirubrobacterales bacterium]